MKHLNLFFLIIFSVLLISGKSFGNTITIKSNTNWSSISPAPTANDAITVQNGATLYVDISNAVCASIQLGGTGWFSGNGTLSFNSNSQLTVTGDITFGYIILFLGFTSGSLDMSNGGILRIAGSMTAPNVGTWTPGAGTIEYYGAAQTVYSNTYNNLTISGSGTKTISSVTINGNFTNNGTLTAGTGTVTFNGTSAQTIGGSSSTTFYNLTINNSNGVTLGTSESVSGTLTLTSGKVTTGDYKLTLGTGTGTLGTLSPANPSSSSYIAGNFERWFAVATNSDFVIFPVGTATSFKPVGIKFTTAPTAGGKILVTSYISDPQTHNTSNLNDAGYTIDRFSNQVWWQITPTTLTGGTYKIELGAYNIDGVSPSNYKKLRVLKRADSSSLWTLSGTHADASGSNTEPLVTRSGLSGFSQFGIGGNAADGNTLTTSVSPVQLASLTSSITGRNVSLKWSTSQEINNSGFEIERKNNGGDFLKVGFVMGKGTVSTTTNYEFSDRNLASGNYSYRLKQIDNNGNFEYFSLNGDVVIGIPTKFDLSQNYPNPFNPTTKVNFDLPKDGMVSLKVYDMSGREVATMVNGFRTAGFYTIDFNAANLSSGVYFYRISAGEFSAVKKMTLIK